MKLTILKAKEMHSALMQMDGVERVFKITGPDGIAVDKVVKEQFGLSGKMKWNIAKNLDILSGEIDRFDKLRNKLIIQVSGGANFIKKDEPEKVGEFTRQINEILELETDLPGILKLSRKGLGIADDDEIESLIPVEVIKALMPIIE